MKHNITLPDNIPGSNSDDTLDRQASGPTDGTV